jgi:hypothetical protein
LTIEPLIFLKGGASIEGEPGADFSKLPGTPPPSFTMQISLTAADHPSISDIRSRIQNDGSFTFAGVAPGTYTVRASGLPSGTWLKSVQLGAAAASAGHIEISSATAASPLWLTLSRSLGRIEGEVITAQGLPSGAAVTFLSDGTRTGVSGVGENGHFTLAELPPGLYRLYAWEDLEMAQRYDPDLLEAYQSQSVLVTVPERGDVHVSLRLIPAPREP